MKVLILSSRARIILKYSCLSTVVIFKNQVKKRRGSRSPDLEPPSISRKIQALSGSLAAHSSRSFDRCLLHWRSPYSALGRFLGRMYSTNSSCTPLLVLLAGPVIFLLSAGGYRHISSVTQFQAHLSGLLHWSRGPSSRAAGGSSLTGAMLNARSVGGVSGSLADRLSNPSFSMQGCCPSSQALLSFTNSSDF